MPLCTVYIYTEQWNGYHSKYIFLCQRLHAQSSVRGAETLTYREFGSSLDLTI